MTNLTAVSKAQPQKYFNWGYHDAAADVRNGRPNKWEGTPHFSPEYKTGYAAGWVAGSNDENTECSQYAYDMATLWGDV